MKQPTSQPIGGFALTHDAESDREGMAEMLYGTPFVALSHEQQHYIENILKQWERHD